MRALYLVFQTMEISHTLEVHHLAFFNNTPPGLDRNQEND